LVHIVPCGDTGFLASTKRVVYPLSFWREDAAMATDTIQEPRLQLGSLGEVVPSGFEAEVIELVAFKLWRRANGVEVNAEGCDYCKGEAQKCYATCR
jgi:hypothetical protein